MVVFSGHGEGDFLPHPRRPCWRLRAGRSSIGGRGTTTTLSPLRKERGTTTPPLGEHHNFPLPELGGPRGGRFRPKVDYCGFFKPRGGGGALPLSAVLEGTSEEVFHWGEGDRDPSSPPSQAESMGAV